MRFFFLSGIRGVDDEDASDDDDEVVRPSDRPIVRPFFFEISFLNREVAGLTKKIVRFLPPLQIVCANTAAIMGAMRFGLMPSVKKNYNGASSYGMVDQASTKNIGSRDPAGFTAVDVLAAGSFATIISAGEILANQVPY